MKQAAHWRFADMVEALIKGNVNIPIIMKEKGWKLYAWNYTEVIFVRD